VLRARGFLVAWGGVLVLAFCEWPPLLAALKAGLNEGVEGRLPEALAHLGRENAGSRWPKVTVGALRPGETLSLEDLEQLRTVSAELRSQVESRVWEVRRLHVAAFTTRSLEQRTSDEAVLLPHSDSCAADADARRGRSSFVDEVMAEWEDGDLAQYLSRVNTGTSLVHYTESVPLDYVSVCRKYHPCSHMCRQ
jgi:hypothetical protein